MKQPSLQCDTLFCARAKSQTKQHRKLQTYFSLMTDAPLLVPSRVCTSNRLQRRRHNCPLWLGSRAADHSQQPANINTTVRRREAATGMLRFLAFFKFIMLCFGCYKLASFSQKCTTLCKFDPPKRAQSVMFWTRETYDGIPA